MGFPRCVRRCLLGSLPCPQVFLKGCGFGADRGASAITESAAKPTQSRLPGHELIEVRLTKRSGSAARGVVSIGDASGGADPAGVHTTLDAATAERIVRVFRAALRPRRQAGRKPDQTTAHAAALWIAGVERCGGLKRHQRGLWQRIYREVIPDYASLDKLTRQYRTQALRRNVKAYLRRKAHKKPRGIVSPHQYRSETCSFRAACCCRKLTMTPARASERGQQRMARRATYADLQLRVAELEEENRTLNEKLDSILDIASEEDEDEEEDEEEDDE